MARRLSWLLLNVLVFAVPLATSNVTWLGRDVMALTVDQFQLVQALVLVVLASLALAGYAASLVLDPTAQVKRSPLDLLVVLFVGWVLASSLLAADASTTLVYGRFEGAVTFVAYTIVFWLALQLTDGMVASCQT